MDIVLYLAETILFFFFSKEVSLFLAISARFSGLLTFGETLDREKIFAEI